MYEDDGVEEFEGYEEEVPEDSTPADPGAASPAEPTKQAQEVDERGVPARNRIRELERKLQKAESEKAVRNSVSNSLPPFMR